MPKTALPVMDEHAIIPWCWRATVRHELDLRTAEPASGDLAATILGRPVTNGTVGYLGLGADAAY
jgi:hypothetical protein